LLRFLGDNDGLGKLARRAAEASPDVAAQKQEALDVVKGKADDKYRPQTAAAAARAERTLKEARAAGGATFAAAAVGLIHARAAQETFGTAVDADELVRLAEEAHQAAPSAATSSALQFALLTRASHALEAREPEYAAMAKRVRRSLDSTSLIAVALWREGKPREAALANADVKRALELVKAQAAAFPDDPSEWQWVLLRAAYPQDAAKIAEALKKDAASRHDLDLDARLTPVSLPTALRQCWALDSAGQPKAALEPLRRCAAEGVPLPFDLP
jgi:hypothetical protein